MAKKLFLLQIQTLQNERSGLQRTIPIQHKNTPSPLFAPNNADKLCKPPPQAHGSMQMGSRRTACSCRSSLSSSSNTRENACIVHGDSNYSDTCTDTVGGIHSQTVRSTQTTNSYNSSRHHYPTKHKRFTPAHKTAQRLIPCRNSQPKLPASFATPLVHSKTTVLRNRHKGDRPTTTAESTPTAGRKPPRAADCVLKRRAGRAGGHAGRRAGGRLKVTH